MVDTSAHVLKVADEAWIALATLHRENPNRDGYSSKEIIGQVKAASLHSELRSGISPHVSLHNVANLPANSARYRMFYRTAGGEYRLFRPDDDFHPSRTGKMMPERAELPEQFHYLLDWYERSYCGNRASRAAQGEDDPFLKMRGVGREIWAGIDPDEFVDDLRNAW